MHTKIGRNVQLYGVILGSLAHLHLPSLQLDVHNPVTIVTQVYPPNSIVVKLKHLIFYAEATVGLDNMKYTVKEDNLQLNICVVVFSPTTTCPIAFPFELIFAANAGTACTFLN